MTAAEKTTLFDWQGALDDEFKGKVDLCDFSELANEDNIILFGQGISSENALLKLSDRKNFHLVQEDCISPVDEVNLSAIMLNKPREFLSDQVKSILNPLKLNDRIVQTIYDIDFTHQEQKYDILSNIEGEIVNKTKSSSLIYDVQSITDELVTNAIFHANSVEDRTNELQKGLVGNLKVAIDDTRVLVSCTDPHGTLNPEKLLRRIHKCYTTNISDTINQGKGGAGIGSFLIHGMSACYIIAVNENVQTTISVVLPLKMSNRKRLSLSKNIHCLYLKESLNE